MSPTWTCASCGLTIRFALGHPVPTGLPNGWAREGGALRCLACRRQAVTDGAKAAHADAPAGGQRRAVQLALAEFELRRDASRADAVIARVAGVTATAVEGLRRELIAEGTLDRRSARARSFGSKNPGAAVRAEGELRRDPGRSNAEIGRAVGVGAMTVARARKRIRAEQEGT